MTRELRILMIEDREDDALLTVRTLERAGLTLDWLRVEDATSMRAALANQKWDAIISDWSLPTFNGLEALRVLHQSKLDLPFIIVSGTIGEETAVDALRAGAHDFIVKGKLSRLVTALKRELGDRDERAARRRAEEALHDTEDQLRQAQKMEAVGRLAGGVAHDFNNMLSVILSYASLTLSDGSLDEQTRENVLEIEKAGTRAADLTRQLLAFSRHQVVATELIDINAVLGSVEKMLTRLLGEDIELTIETTRDLHKIRADRSYVTQLLMNLAVNSRDAMPIGGKVSITTSNIMLEKGPHVQITVTDTGTGMDKETQARIFEPFFTTKPAGKGTGLGLSTVFGIVQQCGGAIRVESEPGQGATFAIMLPKADDDGAPAQPSTPAKAIVKGSSETILIVEDDDQVRGVARGILRRHGYTILEASNAESAKRVCKEHPGPIDLLLSDVVLPGARGTELVAELLQIRPKLKVLLMSGYAGDAIAQRGVHELSMPFLQKPITPESLSRTVRDVLNG